MTSKPVAQLLVDLGVARSHSRPHVSNDNPYSEAQFKTLKYCPAFPGRFGSIEDARAFCAAFFDHYNHVHRHAGIGLHTPASVHYGTASEIRAQRAGHPRRRLRRQPRPVPAPTTDTTEAAHRRLDQRTHPRSTHQIRMRSCLTGLDRFRTAEPRGACWADGPWTAPGLLMGSTGRVFCYLLEGTGTGTGARLVDAGAVLVPLA